MANPIKITNQGYPQRKRKGLVKLFGGLAFFQYFTNAVVKEGVPVIVSANPDDAPTQANGLTQVEPAVVGQTHGVKVIGLTMQLTYDDNIAGQMGQLQGYHFVNDTAQRLNGSPIGILGGHGVAYTQNYVGTIAAGEQAYVGPSNLLANTGAGGDKLPAVFETGGTDGQDVRLRFNFSVGL